MLLQEITVLMWDLIDLLNLTITGLI